MELCGGVVHGVDRDAVFRRGGNASGRVPARRYCETIGGSSNDADVCVVHVCGVVSVSAGVVLVSGTFLCGGNMSNIRTVPSVCKGDMLEQFCMRVAPVPWNAA